MRTILALVLWTVSSQLAATTLAQVPAEELFMHADAVALVELVSGHTLGEGNELCGAIYKGRVIEAFKGVTASYIEFGHYIGYEVGSKYVVFLTKPGQEFRSLNSTNSRSMAAEDEHQRACGAKKTAYNAMHDGIGVLRVTFSAAFGYADSVGVPSDFLKIPDSVEQKPADLGENRAHVGAVWVRLSDLVIYLRGLN